MTGDAPNRCVALPGGEPGLALDREGAVRWMPQEPVDHGLCVSLDDQLVLLRGEGAGPVRISRCGRSVEAPVGKPVVLLDQDLLQLGGRQLRIHVHGLAAEVHAPERLTGSAIARMARAAATALALGAAVGGGTAAAERVGLTTTPIEVRAGPPIARPAPTMLCKVTRIAPSKGKGPLMVHAVCPRTSGIQQGARGFLVDAKGATIPNGQVTVKQVDGLKVVAESSLTRPVKATHVRLWETWSR